MLPCGATPSCRYLLLRVLERLRYDAHVVPPSLRCSKPSTRPLRNRRTHGVRMSTILFRASADYRVRSTNLTGVGIPGSSWVLSLSAPSPFRARQTRFQPRRSPPIGFHNLPAGQLSPGTVCRLIPYGWHSEGLGLQSFTPITIVDDLLVGHAPAPLPLCTTSFPDRTAFPAPAPSQLTCSR